MTCTFLVWIFNETKVPSKGRCVHKIFYLSLSHSRLWRFCLHESKHVRKGRKYYRTFQSLIVDQKKNNTCVLVLVGEEKISHPGGWKIIFLNPLNVLLIRPYSTSIILFNIQAVLKCPIIFISVLDGDSERFSFV